MFVKYFNYFYGMKTKILNAKALAKEAGVPYTKVYYSLTHASGKALTSTERANIIKQADEALRALKAMYADAEGL